MRSGRASSLSMNRGSWYASLGERSVWVVIVVARAPALPVPTSAANSAGSSASAATRVVDRDEIVDASTREDRGKAARESGLQIGDATNVYTAEDVLNGVKDPGKATIIIGAGLVGCETALWLHDKGVKVTIVELAPKILALAGPLCHANDDMLHELLVFKKIAVMTSSAVAALTEGGFIVQTGDKPIFVAADSAILAIGYRSERSLYDKVRNLAPEVYTFGDARQVSNIMYAIWDAYEVARGL